MTLWGVGNQPALRATDDEFYLINELIERSFGVCFPDHNRDLLMSRLRPRVRALHLTSFREYYVRLEANLDGELDRLPVLVTNNETYFFREHNHFEALLGEGLDMLRPGLVVPGTLRALVAGCSSGEEAYTLNFLLSDAFERTPSMRAHIDAFDLDTVRLDLCRQATYRPRSLRSTSDAQARRYLRPVDAERWSVKGEYAAGITFSPGNIIELASFRRALAYDVVFCRNVLIYFSPAALRQAIDNFASVLRPGGLLFLGHSESIIGLSPRFEMIHVRPCLAYRKVGP